MEPNFLITRTNIQHLYYKIYYKIIFSCLKELDAVVGMYKLKAEHVSFNNSVMFLNGVKNFEINCMLHCLMTSISETN